MPSRLQTLIQETISRPVTSLLTPDLCLIMSKLPSENSPLIPHQLPLSTESSMTRTTFALVTLKMALLELRLLQNCWKELEEISRNLSQRSTALEILLNLPQLLELLLTSSGLLSLLSTKLPLRTPSSVRLHQIKPLDLSEVLLP